MKLVLPLTGLIFFGGEIVGFIITNPSSFTNPKFTLKRITSQDLVNHTCHVTQNVFSRKKGPMAVNVWKPECEFLQRMQEFFEDGF